MKKSFVAVALVMGLGTTVAFAENLTSGVETVMAVNDFTPIEVKDLPAAVTEAIAKNFAESTVKEAAVEAAEDGSKTVSIRPRACFSPSYNKVKSQTKHVWLLTLL